MNDQSLSVSHSQGLGLFGISVFGMSMAAMYFVSIEAGLYVGTLIGI